MESFDKTMVVFDDTVKKYTSFLENISILTPLLLL